jgi:ABC-type phosphate transport system substrate-binding protein
MRQENSMLMSKKGGLRTALLAGACVVALGATAGSAAAAPSCVTGSGSIVGRGASLQNLAQNNVWIPAYNAACSSASKWNVATYRGGGSGGGLSNWGFNGNAFGFLAVGGPQTNHYIGSDDAPFAGPGQPAISAAQSALNAAGGSSSQVVVTPVLQAAVAVIITPPANCALPTAAGAPRIDNVKLEQAFDGSATTWSAIGATGSGCSAQLTRAVRSDSSGTTYQFKHYLDVIDSSNSPTWKSLQTAANNTTWPTGSVTPVTGSGGGGVVSAVNATSGSIGYANLADVKAAGSPPAIVSVQNDGTGAASSWVSPVAGTDANCTTADYTNANGNPNTTAAPTSSAVNQDWSEVYGSDPDTASLNGDYPICGLTFDIGADDATGTAVLGAAPQDVVEDFLRYVVDSSGGQAAITGSYYRALPSAIQAIAAGNAALL